MDYCTVGLALRATKKLTVFLRSLIQGKVLFHNTCITILYPGIDLVEATVLKQVCGQKR